VKLTIALAASITALAFAACSGRRLPPGTPPPEYEPPIVTPWPLGTPDAGHDGDERSAGGAPAAEMPHTGVEPELSLDAGPR
jgi:hypothetical protein